MLHVRCFSKYAAIMCEEQAEKCRGKAKGDTECLSECSAKRPSTCGTTEDELHLEI